MDSPSSTPNVNQPPTKAGRLALVGTLLTLTGGVSYFLLLSVPWIRTYAIPNILLAVLGVVICFVAVKRRRSIPVILGTAFSTLIATVFLLSIFVLMRLPPPQTAWAVGQSLPDITLPNQDGREVSITDYRGKGPVLLVFYRGFW